MTNKPELVTIKEWSEIDKLIPIILKEIVWTQSKGDNK